MITIYSKRVREALVNVWPLYGSAFAMATSLSVLWTAMPFIIRNIGGTEEHVGYIWAFNMLGYMLCLLLTAVMLGHLAPRHATRAAAAAMFLATLVMVFVVYYAIARDQLGRPALIWTMIATGTLSGAAMSLFWPFLMSWVSADYEGAILNRRLGTYNGMWSSAAIMGPLIGGVLVDMSTFGPVVVGVVCLAVCFVLLCLAHDASAGNAASVEPSNVPEIPFDKGLLLRFKWMARIALFCSWACLGVTRSQFALLFTDLGFSETQFGIIITIFGICNFLVLTGAGRLAFWHFKPVLLLSVQVILALSIFLIIYGRTLWAFVPSFLIMGFGFGFAYSSHLYYGACGSKKRSAQMAIHEVTISLGVIVGAGTGGYLSGNFGIYRPYWFSIIVLALGLIAQVAVYVTLKPRRHSQPA
ncbi:MAG: MFS transporter [Planctomycetes bacterium]|nr:MFS transporter [Planctomycetota bacterium]MBL7146302.1 MFS transporter [Phycisphaerae bacterium]